MKTRLLVVYPLLSLLFILPKLAIAGLGTVCFDHRRIPVKEIATTKIADIAQAHRVSGAPVILFNPKIVSTVAKPTERFFFWHECAHHVLAHMERDIPYSREQEADCWAINKLVLAGRFSRKDLAIVQSQLAAFGRADETHLPGPARAKNLYRCLKI